MQCLFSYHCGTMLEINIKINLKISHMFSSAVWHLSRKIFDSAIENINKVILKKNRGWLQRRKYLNKKLIAKWTIMVHIVLITFSKKVENKSTLIFRYAVFIMRILLSWLKLSVLPQWRQNGKWCPQLDLMSWSEPSIALAQLQHCLRQATAGGHYHH